MKKYLFITNSTKQKSYNPLEDMSAIVCNLERSDSLYKKLLSLLEKSCSSLVVYESIDEVPSGYSKLRQFGNQVNSSLKIKSKRVSIDIDRCQLSSENEWIKVKDIVKDSFIKNGIHSDLQNSPRGEFMLSLIEMTLLKAKAF